MKLQLSFRSLADRLRAAVRKIRWFQISLTALSLFLCVSLCLSVAVSLCLCLSVSRSFSVCLCLAVCLSASWEVQTMHPYYIGFLDQTYYIERLNMFSAFKDSGTVFILSIICSFGLLLKVTGSQVGSISQRWWPLILILFTARNSKLRNFI